jgi:hypothetical protein
LSTVTLRAMRRPTSSRRPRGLRTPGTPEHGPMIEILLDLLLTIWASATRGEPRP